MKFKLKNRPVKSTPQRYEEWLKGFEKELREQLTHLEKQDQEHMIPLGFIAIRLKEILGE
jgi:hypothetical protein